MTSETGPAPVIAVILAIAALSAMDAVVKALASDYGTAQITTMRYAFGFLFALPLALPALRHGLTAQSLRANLLRGVILVATAYCFFDALGRLPLAFAVALVFTSPLWMVVLSRLILGEPITRRAIVAITLGFAGLLIIVVTGTGEDPAGRPVEPLGIVTALLASFGYALSAVLLRRQSAFDPISVLVVTQAFVSCLVIAPFGLAAFRPPDAEAWLMFVAIGMMGTLGHLLLSWGFKRAPANRLGPVDFTTFLWAVLFGYVFFGEVPDPELYLGAALIVAACLIVAVGPRRRPRPALAAR